VPERVTSRAHYQPCVVAGAVAVAVTDADTAKAAVAREHGCDRRTLGRWIERVAGVADPAILGRALVAETSAPVLPAVASARPSRSPRLGALMMRAASVIALLEVLASVRGLEPPGLAHVAALVPANAPAAHRAGGASSGA
jgi:transposase-like protein